MFDNILYAFYDEYHGLLQKTKDDKKNEFEINTKCTFSIKFLTVQNYDNKAYVVRTNKLNIIDTLHILTYDEESYHHYIYIYVSYSLENIMNGAKSNFK